VGLEVMGATNHIPGKRNGMRVAGKKFTVRERIIAWFLFGEKRIRGVRGGTQLAYIKTNSGE